MTAAARMSLPEMREDGLAPAACRLADGKQRIEFRPLDAFDFLGRSALVDHPPALNDIRHAIGHPHFRRQTIATRPPRLLVVGLDRAREIEMGE